MRQAERLSEVVGDAQWTCVSRGRFCIEKMRAVLTAFACGRGSRALPCFFPLSDADFVRELNPWLIRACCCWSRSSRSTPLLAWIEFHNLAGNRSVIAISAGVAAGWALEDADARVAAAAGEAARCRRGSPLRRFRDQLWLAARWSGYVRGGVSHTHLASVYSIDAPATRYILSSGCTKLGAALTGWKVALVAAATASTNFLIAQPCRA